MPGYISEIDYDGGAASNFVEVAFPIGVDTSAYSLIVYDKDGNIRETFSLGAPVSTNAGQNVYLIDDTDTNWLDLKNSDALALVDDAGTVIQFIAFKDPVTGAEGPADGLDAVQVGEHSGSFKSLVTTNDGTDYSPIEVSDPGVIPCYGPGTEIETASGLKRVEELRPGDLVATIDTGFTEILWISSRSEPFDKGPADKYPVLISAGSLGPERPKIDLIVSPQHRILVGGHDQLKSYFPEEVLVPAKALIALPKIRFMRGKSEMNWHHFALRRHSLVIANGCVSECLLLGPMVTNKLPRKELKRLSSIFGDQIGDQPLNGPLARESLRVKATQQILSVRTQAKKQCMASRRTTVRQT